MSGMKNDVYRGGLVHFAIPSHWIEEYEPDGGGTFYADEPTSGTLRLSVLTFAGKAQPDEAALVPSLRIHGQAELLPTGNAVVRYSKEASEDGTPITLFYWQVANSAAPHHLRHAIFSYTVETRRVSDPELQAELSLLDSVIRAAEFAPELGVSPADKALGE